MLPPEGGTSAVILRPADPTVSPDGHILPFPPLGVSIEHPDVAPRRQSSIQMRSYVRLRITASGYGSVLISVTLAIIVLTLQRKRRIGNHYAIGSGAR